MTMRLGSTTPPPRSSGRKRCGYTALFSQNENRADDDERGASQHRQGHLLAEEHGAPEHAEQRNQIRDRERAGGPEIGDEPEVEEVGDGSADEPERENARDDQRRRGGARGPERDERHEENARGELGAHRHAARRRSARKALDVGRDEAVAEGGEKRRAQRGVIETG